MEELQKFYLPQPDNGKESYWTSYDSESNITEYDFSAVTELLALLKSQLIESYMKDLIKPLHHTSDCLGGVRKCISLTKSGGSCLLVYVISMHGNLFWIILKN